MPHVNDARHLRECAKLLGAPPHIGAAARASGRRPLDTNDPGQQEFQALLLWCLLSPSRSLIWDTKSGRSLRDMHCYYSWVSPQQDRLVTGWTVAARVASYLLPCPEDCAAGFSGIPGLRLAAITRTGVELVHLPTGGRLELRDNTWNDREIRAQTFDSEMRGTADLARSEDTQPLWLAASLSTGEELGLDKWTLTAHAPVLSAVMVRIHALWRYGDTGLEFGTDPATGIPRLSWRRGPSLDSIGSLLTDPSSAVYVAGSRQDRRERYTTLISLGDSTVELRGPELG